MQLALTIGLVHRRGRPILLGSCGASRSRTVYNVLPSWGSQTSANQIRPELFPPTSTSTGRSTASEGLVLSVLLPCKHAGQAREHGSPSQHEALAPQVGHSHRYLAPSNTVSHQKHSATVSGEGTAGHATATTEACTLTRLQAASLFLSLSIKVHARKHSLTVRQVATFQAR